LGRTGKGALFMAKELTFHKISGYPSTVDYDERFCLASAAAVNAMGDKFLAGAGLYQDQDGGIRIGHLLHFQQNPLQGREHITRTLCYWAFAERG